VVAVSASGVNGQDEKPEDPVEIAASSSIASVYRNIGPESMRELPIGVFDSGTGGLTVLQTILTIDAFRNGKEVLSMAADGQCDFCRESFIYLADQANMPYGNYPVVGKEQLLDDLIVKDAWFLMGRECFRRSDQDGQFVSRSKVPVKAIVIACNTATAYGQSDIEQVIEAAGLDIRVIGVIGAGAKGAVRVFSDGQPGTIGVVPTKGTVLSGAYPKAIHDEIRKTGLTQRIEVVQQGAFGLAGAIDGAQEFILETVTSHALRDSYRGPSVTNPECRIDPSLLKRYAFDFSNNRMLYSGSQEQPAELQLNSVENYLAYHLVTLMEQMRAIGDAPPLRAIILGCTHFPFYEDVFRRELDRLRNHQEGGEYVYRKFMAESVELINPAYFTAIELYEKLARDNRLRNGEEARGCSEFYVTVPSSDLQGNQLDNNGWFTYEFKYGRDAGSIASQFRAVSLDGTNLDEDVFKRLQRQVPQVWELMLDFRQSD